MAESVSARLRAVPRVGSEACPALEPGFHLGEYELLAAVAQGGMARVWAARHASSLAGFHRVVAIKTILPELARDASFRGMFLDEARIAAQIHHPNVCQVHELGEHGPLLYLVMEWIHGGSLMNVLRAGDRKPLEPRIAARIIADASAGLHAAHELTGHDGRPLDVVHRDVSPHNLLLTEHGHVKVADFGVAKAAGISHDTTVAGKIKGKVSYMAPEYLKYNQLDRRADVFALGCVLYEASVGRKAFTGEIDAQVLIRIVSGEYERPSKSISDYPAPLEEIIVKALAVDPSKRYPTAQALRQDLERWLASSGAPTTESEVGSVVRARLGSELSELRTRLRALGAPLATAPSEGRATERSGVRAASDLALDRVALPVDVRAPLATIPDMPPVPDKAPKPALLAPPPPARTSATPPSLAAFTPPRPPGAPAPLRTSSPPAPAPAAARSSAPPPTPFPYLTFPTAVATPPPPPVAVVETPITLPLRPLASPPHPVAPMRAFTESEAIALGRSSRRGRVAALLSLLACGVAIGAALLVLPSLTGEKPAAAPSTPVNAPAATEAPAPPIAPSAEPITLVVKPVSATLSVDGVALPPDTRTVPRPGPDERRTVTARSPRFRDATLVITADSPSFVPLTLTPAATTDAAPFVPPFAPLVPPPSTPPPPARAIPRRTFVPGLPTPAAPSPASRAPEPPEEQLPPPTSPARVVPSNPY